MKTLWIDCTRTARSHLHTGIQRYVRSTVREALVLARTGGSRMRVRAICFDGACFRDVGSLDPHPLEVGAPLTIDRSLARGERIDIASEDVVLLPDAGWYCDYQGELAGLHARGVRLVPVLHDALPATHPHCFPQDVSTRFLSYWQALCGMAPAVVCVSGESAAALRDPVFARGADVPPAWVNHPGANFLSAAALQRLSQPDVLPAALSSAMQQRPTVCVVGTIEPRKNHHLILQACNAIWTDGVDFNLLLVGSVGWLCEDIVGTLNRHCENGRRLWFVQGATDLELGQLMRASNFLLSASSAEGFGLPVAEAAWLGVPVLLSDISVYREVAPAMHRFFDLSANDLSKAILSAFLSWPGPASERTVPGGTIAASDPGDLPVLWHDSVGRLLRWIDLQEQESWSMDDSIECA